MIRVGRFGDILPLEALRHGSLDEIAPLTQQMGAGALIAGAHVCRSQRPKYFCRDHVSKKRNAELAEIEKVKGGVLR